MKVRFCSTEIKDMVVLVEDMAEVMMVDMEVAVMEIVDTVVAEVAGGYGGGGGGGYGGTARSYGNNWHGQNY
jgi:hypothetical protein